MSSISYRSSHPSQSLLISRQAEILSEHEEKIKLLFDKNTEIPEANRFIEESESDSEEYEEFNYYQDEVLNPKTLPNFMDVIFTNPYIPSEQKQIFLEEFAIKYLKEKKFKNSVKGKYILFFNNIYTEIIDKKTDAFNYGTGRDSKITIKIGELERNKQFMGKICESLKYKEDEIYTYEDTTIIYKKVSGSIIKCGMGDTNTIIDENRFKIMDKLIDTGCDITPIFCKSLWDFKKSKFKLGMNIDHLENFFGFVDQRLTETCNGDIYVNMIYLKKPLYVTIKGLNPVPIYILSVPLLSKGTLPNLIGLDVISQYTMMISNFNGIVEMRFTEQREEL